METALKVALMVAASVTLQSLAAPNPPTAQDTMIAITPVNRSMEQTGGTAAINTSGSGTWRASASDNWILLTSTSGTAGYPVGYAVSANNGVETRIGYVYVSGHVHTITQAGLGATLGSYSAEFERSGGSGSVQVNAPSGKTWHAKSNVEWITVSAASGTGKCALSFTVAQYDEVSTRSGTLTIADNTFTVHQTGRRMQLTSYSATSDYVAETIKIRVNALASTEWGVSVNADWMAVADAGNGRGGDVVHIALAENQSYNARSGVVTIGTEQFSVKQLGRTALVFKINPTEVSTFGLDGASGERIVVTATPDLGWTASSSADWIELYSGYASGSGSGNVVYKVKPNPTLYPRSGTITVTAADGAVAVKRLEIGQDAAVASLTVDEYEFEAAGETVDVGVNTGSIVGWNVINSLDWLSVSGISMVGSAGITLTVSANTSVQPRSGMIRIADHDFRVSQKGRGVSVSYDEARVFDADGKTTGENIDNVIAVTADADVEWTAVASDPTWIVIYEGMSGKGNGAVKYIVAPYVGSGEIRTGMITIGSEIVYVTQRSYELSIEPNGQWVDGNSGAGEIQVALDIQGVWNAIATEPWITVISGYNSGTGSGKVLFSYTDNNTGKTRTGKIMIAGEMYTLTQQSRQMVAVGASVEGHGGHVSGGGTYNAGAEVTLAAVPEDGYSFEGWRVAGGEEFESTDVELTVTARVAQEYKAVFAPLAPRLSAPSASLKGVRLEWTNLAWATRYRVCRGTTSNRGLATEIAALNNDGVCAYHDASGMENQNYWYWVEAIGVEDDVWSDGVQGRREKKTFAIAYANLRGAAHANPVTYKEGTSFSFASPMPRRGYTFVRWEPEGVSAGTSGDLTVRAIWSQNTFAVQYDANGGSGSLAETGFTYGFWKYIGGTGFDRVGYAFVGWATRASGAVAYRAGESVKNLTEQNGGVVTLHAVWVVDDQATAMPAHGENLIRNGDFETGAAVAKSWGSYADKPGFCNPNWATATPELVGLGRPDGTWVRSDLSSGVGKYAIFLQADVEESEWHQDFEVPDGGMYRLQFNYMARPVRSGSPAEVRLIHCGTTNVVTTIQAVTSAINRFSDVVMIDEPGVYTLQFIQHVSKMDSASCFDNVSFCKWNAPVEYARDRLYTMPVYNLGLYDRVYPNASTALSTSSKLAFRGVTLNALADGDYALYANICGAWFSADAKRVPVGCYNYKTYIPDSASGVIARAVGNFVAMDDSTAKCVVVEFTQGDDGVYARAVAARYKLNAEYASAFSMMGEDGSISYEGESSPIAGGWDGNSGYGLVGLRASRFLRTDMAIPVWSNGPGRTVLTVDDVKDYCMGGYLAGNHIACKGTLANGYNKRFVRDEVGRVVEMQTEFQALDDVYVKCVVVKFTNGPDGVYGQVVRPCYVHAGNGRELGFSFTADAHGSLNTGVSVGNSATAYDQAGYGIYEVFAESPLHLELGASAYWDDLTSRVSLRDSRRAACLLVTGDNPALTFRTSVSLASLAAVNASDMGEATFAFEDGCDADSFTLGKMSIGGGLGLLVTSCSSDKAPPSPCELEIGKDAVFRLMPSDALPYAVSGGVALAEGASIAIDTSSLFEGGVCFSAEGGFIVPEGVANVLDCVSISDPGQYSSTLVDDGTAIFLEGAADPLPDVADDSQVAIVLHRLADKALSRNISGKTQYNAFRAWVDSRGLDHKMVKDSPRAWLSYALDAEGLIEREFKKGDVAIVSLKTADDGVFTLEVDVEGVRIGKNATAENLARVFSVEGTFDLSGGLFSAETVTATFGVAAEGRLAVVAVPKSACSSFFIRVCMMIGVQ